MYFVALHLQKIRQDGGRSGKGHVVLAGQGNFQCTARVGLALAGIIRNSDKRLDMTDLLWGALETHQVLLHGNGISHLGQNVGRCVYTS